MSAAPAKVVIVGGGVTGLSAARALLTARPELEVTLLESRARLGGNIQTEEHEGFLIDAGPDSMVITKPDGLALCKELGLEGELIGTRDEARHVYFVHEGRLELMPGGLVLGVPTRLGPMVSTPLVSWPGKLRMLAEPFIPPPDERLGDESVESFIGRRMGKEAAHRLGAPLLGGIYAGDISQLSVNATFPQLVAMERKHGSLIRGYHAAQTGQPSAPSGGDGGSAQPPRMGVKETVELLRWLRREGQAQASSPFRSLRRGMGSLIDTLAQSLPEGTVHTDASVSRLSRGEGSGWVVETESGQRFEADQVLLACPAHVAAKLVPDERLARELGAIPYVSTATVFFGLDAKKMQHDCAGFGFVVPKGEARLLAGTWVSSKWSGRAPDGMVLVRAFLGGTQSGHTIRERTDEELTLLARSELIRLMGALGEPVFSRVYRYVESNPQPVVGHTHRLERVARCLGDLPGLHVAGAAYDGIGIPDCVRQAKSAARAMLGQG